jgi:hypothetical protein
LERGQLRARTDTDHALAFALQIPVDRLLKRARKPGSALKLYLDGPILAQRRLRAETGSQVCIDCGRMKRSRRALLAFGNL